MLDTSVVVVEEIENEGFWSNLATLHPKRVDISESEHHLGARLHLLNSYTIGVEAQGIVLPTVGFPPQ